MTHLHNGRLEVVCGPMFSGKSEELIRRLRRAQIARRKVQIFKPVIDARYSEIHIVSHSEMKIPSQAVKSAGEILASIEMDTEVVGIDEDTAAVDLTGQGLIWTVQSMRRTSRTTGGGTGEAAFLLGLGALIFWLYYRNYLLGTQYILPEAWRNQPF